MPEGKRFVDIAMASMVITLVIKRLGVQALADGYLPNTNNIDDNELDMLLRYLTLITPIMEYTSTKGYRLSGDLRDKHSLFNLEKFLGAYGPVLAAAIIDDCTSAPVTIDHVRLASAFSFLAEGRLSWLANALDDLPTQKVLELGCGSAPVLRELARRSVECSGWAVDSSEDMVKLAEYMVQRQGFEKQISVYHYDIQDVISGLCKPALAAKVVILRGVLNSFCSPTPDAMVPVLQELAGRFANSYIVVSDYYSCLKTSSDAGHLPAMTQDIVQLLSGQGIPPPNGSMWNSLYKAGGLDLCKRVINKSVPGIRQFVDVLKPSPNISN
jgi:SAM-dependent methyltransferase